jgi:hypothetical protein
MSALSRALTKMSRYLGNRTVSTRGKGMPKGTGMKRRGSVTHLKGGQRVLHKEGGGTSFLKGHSKLGVRRGTKLAGGAAGGSAVVASLANSEGAKPTKTTSAVSALRKVGSQRGINSDISKISKSGYHTYKKGSASAKLFQKGYQNAKKSGAKTFKWGLTGKSYKVG